MNKFTTLIVIFFVIHSIEGKLEMSSKNSFLHFINSEKNELCSTKPSPDKNCFFVTYDAKGQAISGSFNHCQQNEYCINVIDIEKQVKCKPLAKFFGENCEKAEDCYTYRCENKVCARKLPGESCIKDRECGLEEYCSYSDEKATSGVCTSFTDSETECNSSSSKLDKCHPKYQCSYKKNKCILRGVKKDGEKVDHEFECASFKATQDLVCTSTYDEQKVEDFVKKAQAEAFKSVDWSDKNLKLSDYSGVNIGSAKKMDLSYQECVKVAEKKICECTQKLSKQIYVGFILSDTNNVSEDLPDKIIKDVLKSYFTKLGIGFIISIISLF